MQQMMKCLSVILVLATVILNATASEKKFVVVIDAGHGGKDIGAADNSAQEKEINLAVALQLGELLKKKAKDVKVVYTRDDDTFVSLQVRADKANHAKGDIFISIHTNSVDAANKNRSSVCGASTYILGTHKDKNNQQVARRENAVMVLENDYQTTYQGFNPNSDESNIIFEMAQKGNMQNSIRLANEVQKGLASVAGRKNRGVQQAGFWVLWATSMPSILVELDFICNPESASYMTSATGRKKLAEAIYNGIVNYRATLRSPKKDEKRASADNNEADPDVDAVIETVASPRQVTQAAPAKSGRGGNAPALPRRRRSESARRESSARAIEVAVIETVKKQDNKVTAREKMPELLAATPDEPISPKKGVEKQPVKSQPAPSNMAAVARPTVKSTGKNDARLAGGKKTATGKSGQFRARLDKKHTVYKIELFTSQEHLRTNNPRFFGLSPISCVKEQDSYRYLYGETSDKNEIYRMLETVRQDIPEAKIVQLRKGRGTIN